MPDAAPASSPMPAPAAKPNIARAVLLKNGEHTVTLGFTGTNYELHLNVLRALNQQEHKRVKGTIRVQARRIDRIGTGGKYVEPVYGSPRRLAGRVIATDPTNNTITVDATMPVVIKPDNHQHASDFEVGDFVTMNLMPGATFTPAV